MQNLKQARLIAVLLCLQAIEIYSQTYPYIEYNYGTDSGRVCLKTRESGTYMELQTVVADCCSNQITFKNNQFYEGENKCFRQYDSGAYVERVNVSSGCSSFNLTSQRQMLLQNTAFYLGDVASSALKLRSSSDNNERWYLNGSCPTPKENSTVSTNQVQLHSKFLIDKNGSPGMSPHNGDVKLYTNGELWSDSQGCVTLQQEFPKILSELNQHNLVFAPECYGATFVHKPSLETYELMHTGYCIFQNGNGLYLLKCSSQPPAITTSSAATPTSTPAITTSSAATPTSTPAITTSSAATPTSTPGTTIQSTTTHTKMTSAAMTTSLTSSTFSSTRPTPTASSSAATTSTSSVLATTQTPTQPTSTTTTKPPAATDCPGVCHGLSLANPGQQCEDFCKSLGQFCSSSIQTGNSFTAFDVHCNDTTSNMQWQKPYDPAFLLGNSACTGYVNVNETVQCIVDGFNDTNVRRLCKCVQSADEDNFNPWLPWSSCTVSCGGGTQSRSRTCKIDYCSGSYVEENSCNEFPCSIDGGFSSWTAWSSCTVTCGGGRRSKERLCNNPSPMHGGLDCFGERRISEICGSSFCPIHGGWTQWTAWSACDKPCNTGMYRRWRYCTNPSPLYGGNPCTGNDTEAIPCNTKVCPAENIAVNDIRFDKEWAPGMEILGSQNFTIFYGILKTNVRALFEFSDLNSTYQYSLLNSLRQGSVIATFTLYFSTLDSFQILLLQDSIENDKYIGKLKIIGFNNTYNTTIVPGSPPLNVTLTALSKTSIKAEWKEVPKHLQNGNVSGYILFYREKMLMSAPYKSLATVDLNATVFGLSVFTEYVFRVLSYNENGNGLACEEQSVYTQESTPSQPPANLAANATSGFRIIVNWNNIPQNAWNGVPVGAVVKYTDLKGDSGNITVAFPKSFAVLDNLLPVTTYIIDVCETTSVGEGPCQRTQSTTLPSAPTAPPGNVTVDSFIGHKILNVSWDPVSALYIHGDLKGYKIIYTLTKVGGTAVVSAPVIKIVHPSRTKYTLDNLEPNSEYSVEVLAYNEIGDGVRFKAIIGETCSCPPIIYTNYAASKPYIYKDNDGKMKGLFADMLQNLTSYACGGCKTKTSILDYVSNGKNGWADKKSLTAMKKDIDDYVHLSFPIFGSTVLETYNGYAFVSVFPHPGVVYYIIKDTLAKQVSGMISSVLNTWPIFLINVLFVTMSGFCIWALDSRYNSEEFPRSCLPGVLNGMYWSFITMGTHGYGDLTPRSIAARLFAIVWILIGLVNFAIFTGALTTAITTSNVYSDPKIYGVEVAAVQDTVAYIAGIMRNAKINTKANYTSTEQVAAALKRRDVRGALVDVYSAATRNDLFQHNDIVAKKLLKYQSAFGFVLSGDMKNAAPKFRDYLSLHAADTLETMENKTAGFEVKEETGEATSMFSPDSPFLKRTLIAIGVVVIILSIIGISYHYGKKYRRRGSTVPEQFQTLQEIEQICDEEIKKLEESLETVIGGQIDIQLKERVMFLLHGRLKTVRSFARKTIPQEDRARLESLTYADRGRMDSLTCEDPNRALISPRDAHSRATVLTEVSHTPPAKSKAIRLESVSSLQT